MFCECCHKGFFSVLPPQRLLPISVYLINDIGNGFDKHSKTIHQMYGLIQSVISQTDVTMDDITEEYKEYF